MISHTVRDKYNTSKLWIITKTPCRHFNLEQRMEYKNTKTGNIETYRSGFSGRRGLKDIQNTLKFADLEWMEKWKGNDEQRWHTAWYEFHNAELDRKYDMRWNGKSALKRMKTAKKRCLALCDAKNERERFDRLLEIIEDRKRFNFMMGVKEIRHN